MTGMPLIPKPDVARPSVTTAPCAIKMRPRFARIIYAVFSSAARSADSSGSRTSDTPPECQSDVETIDPTTLSWANRSSEARRLPPASNGNGSSVLTGTAYRARRRIDTPQGCRTLRGQSSSERPTRGFSPPGRYGERQHEGCQEDAKGHARPGQPCFVTFATSATRHALPMTVNSDAGM